MATHRGRVWEIDVVGIGLIVVLIALGAGMSEAGRAGGVQLTGSVQWNEQGSVCVLTAGTFVTRNRGTWF